ncbi:uncharacterized protein LTR77_003727 [Saxophila tyrrhenica]|uniref:Phosphogluconate dehydrogenase NAD-binding putative C-terminal domain-containing protein n=1 Tax=Saxophila tyrrhenica TaxID=1690608 RepID=A0AAV9PIR9_9PEZI|nr:hypothetical protein LTR77_003727 [Saxophila tyrrhenica]
MEPAISRVNSWSTNRTLVGSDGGKDSHLYKSMEGTAGQLPIIQTPDMRQWLDVSTLPLSGKLLEELLRLHGPPDNKIESRGNLAKKASKFKAWLRQTKTGADVRFRSNIDNAREKVIDYHIESYPDPKARDENGPAIAELDGIEIQGVAELAEPVPELFDTSAPSELVVAADTRRASADESHDEPLPRYEPRRDPSTVSTSSSRVEGVLVPRPSVGVHQPSSPSTTTARGSDASPTSDHASSAGLDARNTAPGQASGAVQQPGEHGNPPRPLIDLLDSADRQSQEGQKLSDNLQDILAAIHNHLANNKAPSDDKVPDGGGRFRVMSTESYETDTDAEPRIVRRATVARSKGRKSAITSPRRKRSASTAISPLSFQSSIRLDDDEQPNQELFRKQTLPKRLPASAGAEAIWQSLLRMQAKILGPEHPMTYQAKSDLAHSRTSSHGSGFQNLSALQASRELAVQTLGMVHPWVAAFCEELEKLETLTAGKIEGDTSTAGQEESTVVAHRGEGTHMVPHTNDENGERIVPAGRTIIQEVQSSNDPVNAGVEPFNTPVHAKVELPKINPNVPPPQQEHSPLSRSTNLDGLWNVQHQPHRPRSTYKAFSGYVFEGLTNSALNSVKWLQRNYGPERPVEPGKERVRWTCACGEELHDDFVETRQGAARELQAYLNRPQTRTGGGNSPTSPSSSNGTGSFMGSSVGGTLSSTTSRSSYGSQVPSFTGSSDSTKPPQNAPGPYLYPGYTPLADPPWLLVCANEDRHTPKLAHLDMGPQIRSDKDLALSLRDHYFQVNGNWWRSLRIRGLTTIEFVQFEVHQNRFADIRKCPDVPPVSTGDYSFEPGDLLPPVGSTYLLHLFKHPGDYDGERITYLRSPKRNGRLQCGVGWGINMVEGFLPDRVWMVISSLFTLGSLAFMIAWAAIKHDVQGASGVAAWITHSQATQNRAKDNNISLVPNDTDLANRSDYIISIVPPRDAIATAQRIIDVSSSGSLTQRSNPLYYLDLNATSPKTARHIASVFSTSAPHIRYIDGGIIGAPPSPRNDAANTWYRPSIPLSGPHPLAEASPSGAHLASVLNVKHINPTIGSATGLKMCFASLSKGYTALAIQSFTTASNLSVLPQLKEAMAEFNPAGLQSAERGLPSMCPKAYRWVHEMREIAETFEADGGFEAGESSFRSIAEVYELVANGTVLGEEKVGSRVRGTTAEEVARLVGAGTARRKEKVE